MLKLLKWFIGLFSPYVHPFERKVDKFFKGIRSTDSIAIIKGRLLDLMKQNLIIVNVWLEKKFKGYKYLTKSTRRKMYQDVEHIKSKFEEFISANPSNEEKLNSELKSKSLSFPTTHTEKIKYLYAIMQFLKPGKYYHYIKTASFGKLLRDPRTQKMEGDCNQIVTLYIYLYSLKYPLEDLRIKLLPEHVCLHFFDIDVECTTGKFAKYREYEEILPATEIISTNLLDLSDFREEVQFLNERTMVKSAQLAYAISSLKSFVAKNLNIAYKNLAISSLKRNDFDTAIFYLNKTDDHKLLKNAYHNATVYYMEAKDFQKALHYAQKLQNSELKKTVKRNQGIYYYNKDNVDKALEIFSSIGEEKMKKACYMKKYNKLVKKVANVKTLADAKRNKSTYQKMYSLAQKIGDSRLSEGVKKTLSQI